MRLRITSVKKKGVTLIRLKYDVQNLEQYIRHELRKENFI